jgi:hypothetical protein
MTVTFQTVPPVLSQPQFNAERQAFCDALNALTSTGIGAGAYSYLIRKSGAVYEAYDSTAALIFGGSGDAGGAHGTSCLEVEQAVSDALAGVGGEIVFAPGVFPSHGWLIDDDDAGQLIIRGSGKSVSQPLGGKEYYGTTLRLDDDGDLLSLVGNGGNGGNNRLGGVNISCLNFDGDDYTGKALELTTTYGVSVTDCAISQFNGDDSDLAVIDVNNSWQTNFHGVNTFENNAAKQTASTYRVHGASSEVTWDNHCHFGNDYSASILFFDSSDGYNDQIAVLNNHFEGSGNADGNLITGSGASGNNDINIQGNVLGANTDLNAAIEFTNCSNINISNGNVFAASTKNGGSSIILHNPSYVGKITGNIFYELATEAAAIDLGVNNIGWTVNDNALSGSLLCPFIINYAADTISRNNAGWIAGLLATPFDNWDVFISPVPSIHAASNDANPTPANTYTVVGNDVIIYGTGGTNPDITIKDPSDNVIATGLTSLTAYYLPIGYQINYYWDTSQPTVKIYGVK